MRGSHAVGVAALLLGACVDAPSGDLGELDHVGVGVAEQAATACADGPTIRGMDVSYYEDSVDWVAAHRAGIEFAFIRVTDGVQYLDPRFAAYWQGARDAGVIRGAYQFFRPAEDPIAQADLLLRKMGPLLPGDLPPVIDVEVSGGLAPAEVEASVRAWVDHVTEAIGRAPIVYAGLYSWHDLTGSANLTTSPLWVAQYTSAACPNIPTPWTRWAFWQDTSTGSVDGVPGATLDLNWFNGTRADLLAFTEPGACGDGACSGGETTAACPADCPPCGTIAPDGGEIDDGDACFVASGPAAFLRHVASGAEGDLIWTHATAEDTQANFADWQLYFAEAGRYRVEAYTAHAYATSRRARYVIEAAGAETRVTIDQTAVDGWQSLGELRFDAGGGQSVHLADNTGEAAADNRQLVFDAIRLTRVDDGAPPTVEQPPAPPAADPPVDGGDEPRDLGGCAATHGGGGSAGLIAGIGLVGLGRRRRRRAARPCA